MLIATGIAGILLLISCGRAGEKESASEVEGLTPVTITHPVIGELSETVSLNAYSSFLIKTSVKSDINGYLQKVLIQPGEKVRKGQELFVIRSKESEHLGNIISKIDTAFHFEGIVSVSSPSDGYITGLSYKAGDYVQDNETLASVSDMNSLVFLLQLPYELIGAIPENRNPEVVLPDGSILKGTIGSSLPAVDPESQTLSCVVKAGGHSALPENLIATVKFFVKSKSGVTILPRESILTDEAQTEFWIMKMTDSSTAVKIPVTTGMVTSDKVEITSPVLSASDIILLTGNYGLPDTAKVIIENKK